MRCEYCGANNAQEEKFCSGCGSPLRESGNAAEGAAHVSRPISEIQCPHCGKKHPSTIWSCPETGGDLSGTAGAKVQSPASCATAQLSIDGGSEIQLTGEGRQVGRDDFDRTASTQDLQYISRRHLLISVSDGTYYIEDPGSKNGTIVNGTDITGREKQALKDGDRIELGKVVTLTFKQD
jgi:hypothetical protein